MVGGDRHGVNECWVSQKGVMDGLVGGGVGGRDGEMVWGF